MSSRFPTRTTATTSSTSSTCGRSSSTISAAAPQGPPQETSRWFLPAGKGELPAGVTPLDVATDKIWLWGRLRLTQGEDKAPVLALQKEFRLTPLSAFGKTDAKPQTATLQPLPDIAGDELGFFTQLGAAVKANPIKPADEALFAQFPRIGLTKDGFDASKLDAARRKGLLRALQDGPSVAISAFQTAAVQRNGWSWATGLDDFGFDYPLRALVSGPYLGGQGEKEAMYPLRYTDSAGKVLTGENAYTIRFASPPPVDAFWSLTIYNAGDKLLVDNPIGRYKVGTDTQGLVTAADGSITIPLRHAAPDGDAAKNWLPTPARAVLSGAAPLPAARRGAERRVSAAGGRAGQIGRAFLRAPARWRSPKAPRLKVNHPKGGNAMNRRQMFLSTAKAALASAIGGSSLGLKPSLRPGAGRESPGRQGRSAERLRAALPGSGVQRGHRANDRGFQAGLSAAGFGA